MAVYEPTVFVIDDDLAVRNSICWLISALDLPVQAFSSGHEFLASVETTRCGCAIVDVRMPGMSGLRLQQEIKDRYPDLSMVVMSADESPETAARAVAEGALGFLEKPVDDETLIKLVQEGMKRTSGNSQG